MITSQLQVVILLSVYSPKRLGSGGLNHHTFTPSQIENMANGNDAGNAGQLSRSRTINLILYNVLLSVVMAILLYVTILKAAKVDSAAILKRQATATASAAKTTMPAVALQKNAAPADTGSVVALPAAPDTNSSAPDAAQPASTVSATPDAGETPYDPRMITYVLVCISLAGGLGAALSNLRGIFEFSRDQSYIPDYLEMPFYLRPVSGVICGLFTFFLGTFFAGALTQGDNAGWKTLQGMFPYIGIAFIAGFASQEFMERLKETAKSLFGVPTTAAPASSPSPTPTPDEGHESFQSGLEGLNQGAPRSAPPPPSPPPGIPPSTGGRKPD